IGPAIASGNAIIVKPATLTPVSALLLAEAFVEAALPDKILSVITGSGSEIGDTLITHPSINMVSFTGGLNTGESIAKKAGLMKLSMELGSNSPTIILKDAEIDAAVDGCVSGAYGAVGQNCIGVQRIFIEKPVYNQFVDQFVEQTKRVRMGNKQDEATEMGPLIAEIEEILVEELVTDGVEHDGVILPTGGYRDGAYDAPPVVSDVVPGAKNAHEDIFGAVVVVVPVGDIDEAI